MPNSPISSLDAVRAKNPDLALAVYAYEPGGDLTLEALLPTGETFTWTAPTLETALKLASLSPDIEPDIFT